MAANDTCVTIVPYFNVPADQREAVGKMCEQFVAKTNEEPGCLYYGFSFHGDEMHCREGYVDAEAALAHLDNVGALLEEVLKIIELTKLEVHGPEEELAKLREPLAAFEPKYFVLEYGFRR